MRAKNKRQFLISTLLSLLLILAVPAFTLAQSYVEPEGPPPQSVPNRTAGADPAIQFLNGSTAEQRKLGSFIIGERDLNTASLPASRIPKCTDTDLSGCSKLCLNGNPANGANDPNCIRDWSEITYFVGGPFLRLLSSAQATQVDPGFVSLRSFSFNQQLISLISEANTAVNGSEGIRAESTSTSHYAGQFAGRVGIGRSVGTAPLCLHGSCITDWGNAVPAPADSISLQGTGVYSQQVGHLSLSGLIMANSVVVGYPSASTPTNVSCGDGICSTENSESVGNCPVDCS